jgi:hypothetical protein
MVQNDGLEDDDEPRLLQLRIEVLVGREIAEKQVGGINPVLFLQVYAKLCPVYPEYLKAKKAFEGDLVLILSTGKGDLFEWAKRGHFGVFYPLIEEKYKYWFEKRKPVFDFDEHDRLHNHYMIHKTGSEIRFMLSNGSPLPQTIADECFLSFKRHFGQGQD